MDLQTLSTLDDLLSDVLLDGIHLWFQTHKMNKDYRSTSIPPGKILDIIQRKVIFERKLPEAVKELLELEPIKSMFTKEKEIQDFGTHARRYLSIYLPSAGFEISQTDRYSAVTNKSEACVIANRPFEAGDELRYCAGTIANLTEQEEKDLETKTSDFSVIKTSRRGTCLFLGPARFVNHDCDPNCSFMSAGSSAIYFKVQKPISVNDEITTHYGDNYFGVDNQECLCATCERLGQGGYKDKIAAAEEPQDDVETPEPELEDSGRRLRNRRGKTSPRKPKENSVRPSTPLPPVESDTIPRTNTPSTPNTHVDPDTVGDQSSVDRSMLGEISTIAVPSTTIPVASSTKSSDAPPAPLTELDSTLLQRSIASPVPRDMELRIDTPPLNSFVSSSDSEKLTSSVSSDQPVVMEIMLSQKSVMANAISDLSLPTQLPTVTKLSMDDDSPFVDDTRSHDTQSSEDDSLLSDKPSAINCASLADKSSLADDTPLTNNSSTLTNSLLEHTLPVAENFSDDPLRVDIPPMIDSREVTRTTQPAPKDPEGLQTDSAGATVDSDQAGDPALVDMMTFLQLSMVGDGEEPNLQDGHEQPRATKKEAVEHDEDDPAYSDQFDGDLSDAGVDEDIVMLSPKNFRMSLDFLCHTGARTSTTEKDNQPNLTVAWSSVSQDGRSDTTNGNSRRASVQLSEVGDEMGKPFQKKVSKRARAVIVVSDPEHCVTCKAFIPEHERNDSDDCRRCYRHFAIYGIAWPSRSKHVIAERYKKAAQEERDKARKKQLAEASRAAAKEGAKAKQDQVKEEAKAKHDQAKEEAKAKHDQAKEEARAKQEQAKAAYRAHLEEQRQLAIQKIAMRKHMGLPPVEKTKLDLHKKRRMKSSNALGFYHSGYSYPVEPSMQPFHYEGAMPSMAHTDMISVSGQAVYPQMEHPQATYQGTTSNLPAPYHQDYYYPVQQDYSYEHSSQPTMLVHPFHCAPYLVFVDPMDENPNTIWWVAVTVPRHQMDESMPQCGSDPDLIVVRFLEEYAYAVCNISGLKLFHPDKEPYKSYADRGPLFFKIPCVKRALSFLNEGYIPPRLPWKNMSFVGQMSLPDIDKAVQDFPRKAQEMRNMMQFHQLRYQYQQSIQHLQHMRSNNSIDPFAIQEHELRLDQEYLHREEQLRCEMQQIGGSMEDYNTTSITMVKRFALSFINDNSMDIQHFQVQQQPPPATKVKRSRKLKSSIQRDDSHHLTELRPASLNKEVPPSKPLEEPPESTEVSNSKSKKRRGPSKRQLQIDLQLSDHTRLLEAARIGLHSFKAADGTVFTLASLTPVQVESDHTSNAVPSRRSIGPKSRVAGMDPTVQLTSSMSGVEATATTTTIPKARRRRQDKQTVDVGLSDPLVSLSTMTLPRSISLEPVAHQLVVMDSSSRFASLPGLLKTNDSKYPLSSTWDMSSCEYSLTESRVIEGRYNCIEIINHPARMLFLRKAQDGDAFLFDSDDLSGVSTPASSDSTETDVSLAHGGTPEPSVTLRKSRRIGRTDKEDADWDECERVEADGGGIDSIDNHSTTDTFDASELSSLMPSSSSSSLGEGDQDIDVVGYDDDQVPSPTYTQNDETQFIDIESLTPADHEALEGLTPADREAVEVLSLLQTKSPDFVASSTVALRRAPPMVVWDHIVAHHDGETSISADTPKHAPRKRSTKKSRTSSSPSNAGPSTTSSSPPPKLKAAYSISEHDTAVSEDSQVRSRSRKAQPGKSRRASSSKSKVTMSTVKRQIPSTVADGDMSRGLVVVQERRAITGKGKKIVVKEWVEERAGASKDHKEVEFTRRQRKKKRSRKEPAAPIQNATSQVDSSAGFTVSSLRGTMATAELSKSPRTAPVPSLLETDDSRASPSASSSSSSSCPATESPEPPSSFSAIDVTDNKELQSLRLWSIKGGIIGFDIDSSVRSVRSRHRNGESPVAYLEKPSNEVKGRPRKRRRLIIDEEAAQSNPKAESAASTDTEEKAAGDGSTLIDDVESEKSKVVTGPVVTSETERLTPETVEDKHTSDDSVAAVDVGRKDAAAGIVDTQEDELTVPASSQNKKTCDDLAPPVDVGIEKSRIITGKVTSSKKDPAIVMVKFTLALRADSGKFEGAPETQDPFAVVESLGVSTVSVLSSAVPKKQSRKKAAEVLNDRGWPVAMSTRKRSLQDTADLELAVEDELIVTRTGAQGSKDHVDAALETVVGTTTVKRRRVRRSHKSMQDESQPSQDETPPEKVETPSDKNESPTEKGKVPSRKAKALSKKDQAPSEKIETPSEHVKIPSKRVKAPSSKKGKASSTKDEAASEKVKASSRKAKAPLKKGKAIPKKGKILSNNNETAPEEEEGEVEEEVEVEDEPPSEREEEEEEGEIPLSHSGKQGFSLVEKSHKRQSTRPSRAPAVNPAALATEDAMTPFPVATTTTSRRNRHDKVKKVSRNLVSRLISLDNIAEARLRNRNREAKLPNTSRPKFEVGDSVMAPGENNIMFECEVKARRDHEALPEVYEYKVHYEGYPQKYDAWIEEKQMVAN
ncbi:Histone-lysine N-methyltransferase set9 [Linnemannia schmuckeri]|uniref:Histone-lysine N-methyltransferase SET9 n=1 Tax=Linnemannia schmuckeri TaxID=64567 RepID=A0A9P5S2L0_9FUNG|nr:Histone-lysine N-methyltransferase set9 [Linnemannia schmuckeri]